ncbi:histidine phosphatase family protein [Halarcobacter anaerophilus]|uniref:histidine phosphatase family protein n=1 Tax=Halarcobacter anaerophilus TaxID=877500 RepID=UPI0005C92370|nr:histidine phosphatase family protein [Halarcobacter anaerophilus]
MAIITLLRHAPLPLKYQKRYIGHSDINIDLSLIDFSFLDEIQKRDYDLILSSDLKRCTQTLDLLGLSYKKDKRLREVEFKEEFELKNFDEIEKTDIFDKKYLDSFLAWHGFLCKESFNKFQSRVEEFLKELPKNKDILICSHGGTIKMINSILKKEDYCLTPFTLKYLEKVDINIT